MVKCVSSKVRTEFLNIIYMSFGFKGLIKLMIIILLVKVRDISTKLQ
jgi:hypothetical protein